MNRARIIFEYMLDREGKPINTFTLERLGGRRSWRTRVADARKLARLLRRDIVNAQRHRRIGKRTIIDSTYTLVRLPKRKAA